MAECLYLKIQMKKTLVEERKTGRSDIERKCNLTLHGKLTTSDHHTTMSRRRIDVCYRVKLQTVASVGSG